MSENNGKVDIYGTQKIFQPKLVLNQWLLTRFGIDPLADHQDAGKRVAPIERLTKTIKNADPALAANRQHLYVDALLAHYQPSWGYTDARLQGFDDHLVADTETINRRRRDPIQWEYFQ